jgi:hypothetical protein
MGRTRPLLQRIALLARLTGALAGVPFMTAPVYGAGCPASVVLLDRFGTPAFMVDADTYDSTLTTSANEARVLFDRTQATLSLSAISGGRLNAAVRLIERFDLDGAAPGTPVNATLEFRLVGGSQQSCGGAGCGVRLEGWLIVGADSVLASANESGPGSARHDIATTLSLPVTFVAGAPFEAQFFLTYGTGPGGSAEGALTGSYAVSGLPSGVHAHGCAGAPVTPVRRTSWGSLKTMYH